MNGVVMIPSTDVRAFDVDQWSNDLARGPLVLTDASDRRITMQFDAISPSAAPLDNPPIADTPGLRAYRRGVGPVQAAAPLSRYLALEVTFNGVDADEATAIALSIPVMGSPQLFEAPDDPAWDGKPDDEDSVRAVKAGAGELLPYSHQAATRLHRVQTAPRLRVFWWDAT